VSGARRWRKWNFQVEFLEFQRDGLSRDHYDLTKEDEATAREDWILAVSVDIDAE